MLYFFLGFAVGRYRNMSNQVMIFSSPLFGKRLIQPRNRKPNSVVIKFVLKLKTQKVKLKIVRVVGDL